jgi:hypothetical protein
MEVRCEFERIIESLGQLHDCRPSGIRPCGDSSIVVRAANGERRSPYDIGRTTDAVHVALHPDRVWYADVGRVAVTGYGRWNPSETSQQCTWLSQTKASVPKPADPARPARRPSQRRFPAAGSPRCPESTRRGSEHFARARTTRPRRTSTIRLGSTTGQSRNGLCDPPMPSRRSMSPDLGGLPGDRRRQPQPIPSG